MFQVGNLSVGNLKAGDLKVIARPDSCESDLRLLASDLSLLLPLKLLVKIADVCWSQYKDLRMHNKIANTAVWHVRTAK